MDRIVQCLRHRCSVPVIGVLYKQSFMSRSTCRPCSYRSSLQRPLYPRITSIHKQCVMPLSTSGVNMAGKIGNTRKKLIKPVTFKAKSMKMQREVVTIWPNMTVTELASVLNKDIDHVFEVLIFISNGAKYDKPTSVITDINIIKDIVDKTGRRWMMRSKKVDEVVDDFVDISKRSLVPEVMAKRPPVVTIMGHVDHGKTTLLDALRQTNVVAMEFGGITQHIGAFSVKLSSGETITFLDTPGHAAFSAMRARGAQVTDIVVLVVAADDGVMKQTVESIRYAKEAGVPIVVAINKVDKPDADVERTKRMLLEYDIQLEDFGGEVQAVPISALKGTNLVSLQEAILALSEVLECRADYNGLVEATVIESRVDIGRGKLSTALVQQGTLKKGSVIVAGAAWAKVRGMFNDKGQPVSEAPPGAPVEIIGWKELPSAGDLILEVESEQRAKEIVEWRRRQGADEKASEGLDIIRKKAELHDAEYQTMRQQRLDKGRRAGAIYRKIRSKETIETNTGPQLGIVIKGDVDGSLEAILNVIDSYPSSQCQLNLLNYGVGNISEYDVEMAAAFNGVVYGFNVVVPEKVAALAKSKKVELRLHNVIYRLIADLKERLTEQLPAIDVEEVVGEANVLAQFTVTEGRRKVSVAGCRCLKGILSRKNRFKLIRDGEVVATGDLMSLKHFKNEVESIKNGVECGLSFTDQTVTPKPGDTVVCFEMKKQKQALNWDLEF